MRCAMIFEVFEIDYANVKLIPVLDDMSDLVRETREAPFQKIYQSYVTALPGPEAADTEQVVSEKEPPIGASNGSRTWRVEPYPCLSLCS